MKFITHCMIICLLTLVAAGCGGSGSQNQTIAIVDLGTVLKLTGVDLQIATASQDREKQIMQGLQTFQKDLEDKFKEKQDEFGEEPTDEQNQELQSLAQALSGQSQQARAQANQNMALFQRELYQRFQEQVKAVSMEIAREQKYQIIMAKSDSILAFDSAIDITDLVVDRLKQASQNAETGLATGEGTTSGGLPGLPGNQGAPITPPAAGTSSLSPTTPPMINIESTELESKPAEKKANTDKPADAKPETTEEPKEKETTPTSTSSEEKKPETPEPSGEASAETPETKSDATEKPAESNPQTTESSETSTPKTE